MVPQLRFPGFSGEWEERKLGDVLDEMKSGLSRMLSNDDIGLPVVRANNVNDGTLNLVDDVKYWYIDDPQGANTSKYLVHKNDILVNFINSEAKMGTATIVDEEPDRDTIYTTNIMKLKVNSQNDPYFVFNQTFCQKYKNYVKSITKPAVNQASFTTVDFKKFDFSLPVIEEQQKIGAFFKQLDHLITLHQRKLTHLQARKKGLLQKMFPKDGEQFPELRFPEFTDAWEQRKLKDITERVRGNDGRMDLPTLTISAGSGWLDQRDRFSSNIAGNEQQNYTLLSKGELSYNHGNSKLAKYGAVFSLRSHDEALVPRVYHSFKPTEEAFSDFIEYMFATKRTDRELGKLISSGARMDGLLNINYEEFSNINIVIPKIEEQIVISVFFKQLDNSITLHQRKLDHLQNRKKALLQQMFV